MPTRRSFTKSLFAGSVAMALSGTTPAKNKPAAAAGKPPIHGNPAFPVHYRTIDIDGVSLFYREAGAPDAPVVLLLHGWPSSSAMFHDLIGELLADYHVFAPDYPGFGNSEAPDPARFRYTFDAVGEIVGKFVDKVGIGPYALYATDFGGPVGYRVMLKTPRRMKALIAQNNPLFPGESPWFGPLVPYWKDGSAESRRKAGEHYHSMEVVRDLYLTGVRDPSLVDPQQWQADHAWLQRPGVADISLDLLYDIRNSGPVFKSAQEYLLAQRPPTLVVSGRNDILFPGANQERYRELLPKAELRLTDSGHCALADKGGEIAGRMRAFLGRVL